MLQARWAFVDLYHQIACCVKVSILGTKRRWIRHLSISVSCTNRYIKCTPALHVCTCLSNIKSLNQYLHLGNACYILSAQDGCDSLQENTPFFSLLRSKFAFPSAAELVSLFWNSFRCKAKLKEPRLFAVCNTWEASVDGDTSAWLRSFPARINSVCMSWTTETGSDDQERVASTCGELAPAVSFEEFVSMSVLMVCWRVEECVCSVVVGKSVFSGVFSCDQNGEHCKRDMLNTCNTPFIRWCIEWDAHKHTIRNTSPHQWSLPLNLHYCLSI